MPAVTYRRLDEVLRHLGFSVRITNVTGNETRVYKHAESGALLPLPAFPLDDPALPRHLVAARGTLEWSGILEPADFDALLQKAG